jgi:hypothetical protein
MQGTKEFARVFLRGASNLGIGLLEKDTVEVCEQLVASPKDIGALVFVCTNLSPVAKAVQDRIGLPIFDFVSLANLVHSSTVREAFTGFM